MKEKEGERREHGSHWAERAGWEHALTRGALTTGANDVANSFSTAVASKTLTHRQAIVVFVVYCTLHVFYELLFCYCEILYIVYYILYTIYHIPYIAYYRQAIILALFAEFAGAMVLGSSVTDTVRKKILDVKKFEHDPYVLMLGQKPSKSSLYSDFIWYI